MRKNHHLNREMNWWPRWQGIGCAWVQNTQDRISGSLCCHLRYQSLLVTEREDTRASSLIPVAAVSRGVQYNKSNLIRIHSSQKSRFTQAVFLQKFIELHPNMHCTPTILGARDKTVNSVHKILLLGTTVPVEERQRASEYRMSELQIFTP